MIWSRPSSKVTLGSQPNSRLATVISGRRIFGSSLGKGAVYYLALTTNLLKYFLCQFQHGELTGVTTG